MNEHVEELLSLYALGGLESGEAAQVETHLAQCAACRSLAQQEQRLVQALALAVPPQAPSPRLRARLLERVGAAAASPAGSAQPTYWLALPRWVLAGLSLALALLTGWNVYLTRQINGLQQQARSTTGAVAFMAAPTTQAFDLVGGDEAIATGRAFVGGESQEVVLVVQNLSPLPVGQVYQTWVVTDLGATSAGLLEVSNSGWAMKWLDVPLVAGGWICVSVEPEGGSREPTDVVLWGGN
jgi:anti-sigma-K factor RskA